MWKTRVISAFLLCWMTFPAITPAAERLRFSTNAVTPPQHLPALAAQEQRIWQKHGIDAEWSDLRGAPAQFRSMAAGRVDAGIAGPLGVLPAAARGVPLVIVSSVANFDYFIWVPVKSPIASPKDLKGAKIAVTAFGGSMHAFSHAAVTALGIDKEVKFVATGGLRESLATIKVGATDAYLANLAVMASLKVAGEFRDILAVSDYLPKDFAPALVVVLRKGFLKENPDTSKRITLAVRDAVNFIRTNPSWASQKLESDFGQTGKATKLILEEFQWSADGKITAAEVEGTKKFAIQYGLAKAEDFPPLTEYFVPILGQ